MNLWPVPMLLKKTLVLALGLLLPLLLSAEEISNRVLLERMDQRFAQMDQRFDALQKQLDRRFTAVQLQMDQRFEQVQEQIEFIHQLLVALFVMTLGAPFLVEFLRNRREKREQETLEQVRMLFVAMREEAVHDERLRHMLESAKIL